MFGPAAPRLWLVTNWAIGILGPFGDLEEVEADEEVDEEAEIEEADVEEIEADVQEIETEVEEAEVGADATSTISVPPPLPTGEDKGGADSQTSSAKVRVSIRPVGKALGRLVMSNGCVSLAVSLLAVFLLAVSRRCVSGSKGCIWGRTRLAVTASMNRLYSNSEEGPGELGQKYS